MKGSKTRSLLHWVLFIVFLFLAIHRSKGSASHPPTVSPPKEEGAPPNSTTPDSRPRITDEEPSGRLQLSALPLTPVTSSVRRFPLISLSIQPSFARPAPSATRSAQNISFHSPVTSPALIATPVNHGQTYGVPVAAPSKEVSSHLYPVNHSHGRGFSPAVAPVSTEVKKSSNTTQAPTVSPSHPLRSSPMLSPMPLEGKQPSNVTDAPLPSHLQPSSSPHAGNEPLVPPLPSHIRPSKSSPAMSPAPHEVNNSLNASHRQPSGSSPAISPTPHEVKEPSNITDSPLPSSPPPHEVKEPSTHSPLPSHPLPLKSSPLVSPVPHEATDPSHNAHSPLASHPKSSGLSPVTSPVPHVVKEPSNTTHSPLPSESSPAISPAPPEVIVSTNSTHAPLASHPKPSGSSPEISPAPPVVKEPSNITHSPFPSESPPVISPSPQVVEDPSNVTHAPLPSDPKPSRISPMISPRPPEVNPSNITHSHSPSHPPPLGFSPVPAPPHEAKDPSNITHAPLASQPMPSQSTPAMSPTVHESKDPSNDTLSPLPSHPLPSQSSPVMSPTPHEREPSNITHSPLPSRPRPSEHSPAVSPMPHGVKNQSNATEAPLASHRHPSVSSPLLSPMPYEVKNPSNITHAPMPSHPHPPSLRIIQTPSVAPTISGPRPGASIRVRSPSFSPLSPAQPSSHNSGPIISPAPSRISAVSPSNKQRNGPSSHISGPIHPPSLPPGFSGKRRAPSPQPFWPFPPPPPNLDCKPLSCKDPLTYPPPGSLCVCVSPIKVGLRLRIALYTFFPLVSELAQEIASEIFMKQSQVRVMGANAASEDSEKTIILIDLVPLGRSFDMNTAFLVYDRFWHKQVLIKASYFGDYDVLYVLYPGLPPSPPMASGESVDGGTLANGENARTMKPLGVDVGKREEKLSGSIIAIIVLSSVMALVISVGAAWLLLLKCRNRSGQLPPTSQQPVLPLAKPSGSGAVTLGSRPSSTSASFTSSIAAHTGSAKTFSLAEVERATDRFHDSRIIGEGGFGRVYQGTFEDGTMVAVKVLKRDDHQGGREFLAEVEMLSRLHHRNLVKLIGICTEENVRCLVYELIPNGSVESHLHGLDKETSPLDWNARMKIALGAARGLAYLHEDSSPRVIHRDFKSSNILLEHDFTPKVSDFGLARTALDGGNNHISTRVMGTFGYVAPEYAMTGHLLIKSDVYSYGVVLLELLTGRKPIDMSERPGQENLVSWARPLLTSMDGLETLIDPALSASISLDTVAQVAAIASMCVQPEVSHRPFMGEVVQALKLVCNESDEHRRSCSQYESSTKDSDIRISRGSSPEERVLSESDIFCKSATFASDASGSFRRYSSSGPLKAGRSQMLWETVRGFSSGSMTERGVAHRFDEEHWP